MRIEDFLNEASAMSTIWHLQGNEWRKLPAGLVYI